MKITLKKRLILCWEILTARGKGHSAQVKQLSLFIQGYRAGYRDANILRTNHDKNTY